MWGLFYAYKLSDVMEKIAPKDALENTEQVNEFIENLSSQLQIQVMQGNIITLK